MNKKDDKKRIVILDTHAILHRAYHALPNFTSSTGEPTGALYGLATMLLKTINEISPDYIIATYDLPEPTHRHEVYEDYKAGRREAEEALVSQIINSREIMSAFNIPVYEKPGFEADDILATIVEELRGKDDVEIIITSGDMDTLQLVEGEKVRVYTLRRGIKDTKIYDEEAVKERYGFAPEHLIDFKGLCGDQSDNIPGVLGIGEKTATDLIQKFGSVEEVYKSLEKNEDDLKGAGIKPRVINLLKEQKEEAEFSKTLATVRKDAPISFKLPKKKWSEEVDKENIKKVFEKFEFRSLYSRLEEYFKGGENSKDKKEEETEKEPTEREIKEISIALWLLNSTMTDPDLSDILRFAGAKSFKKASEDIFKKLKENGLYEVYKRIEEPLIDVVKKIEERGIKIDKKKLTMLSEEYHKELSDLEKKIWKEAGEEFNINSPKQMGEVLFEKMGLKAKNHKKTSTGTLSTRESELEKMAGERPIIDKILEYREIQKLLSTYIDNIPEMLDSDDRLHAEFVQTGTTTGRMSSKNPNLQNIPIRSDRGKKIRESFVPSFGFSLVSMDYSQIELRVAAFLSGDAKLTNIFKEGKDPHTSVAAEVFDVPESEVDHEMRRKAKIINFGILYGMGINALKTNLGSSREEAQKYLEEYFDKFSGLSNYLEETKQKAKSDGYTETYFGRRRYIEGIRSNIGYIQAGAERMAVNAPIQGTSADMIKISMSCAEEKIEKANLSPDARLLLSVHDELVYEIKKEKVDEVTEIIKGVMESVITPEETGGFVFEVDVNVGFNWGALK